MNDKDTIIDGYKIINQMNVAKTVFFIGERKLDESNMEYITGTGTLEFSGIVYNNINFTSDNYQKVFDYFLSSLGKEDYRLINEQKQRPKDIILDKDCHSIHDYDSLVGKVIVLKHRNLYRQSQTSSYRLYLVVRDFGYNPQGRGNAVYAINLYSGDKSRLEKYELFGVIKDEKMPDWAKEKLITIMKKQKNKNRGVER